MRLIDADALCEGRVSNDSVVIAAKCAPTIDAVPVVHGRWTARDKCSERGGMALFDGYEEHEWSPYCPYCGAKMDGGAADG